MRERKYFPINEDLTITEKQYRGYADRAYDLAEKIEGERPREADRAWRIATTYARCIADNINHRNKTECMRPSVLMSENGNLDGYIVTLKNILHGYRA